MIPPLFAWHAMLLQEPWCMTPGQVAGLTAWQAEHLYVRPALERNRRLAERAEGGGVTAPPAGGGWDWAAGPPPKHEFVSGMLGQFGGSSEKWAADWEELNESHQRRAAGGLPESP